MSATDDKDLSKPREDSGKVRRTYASLQTCRGFTIVASAPQMLVAIKPMDVERLWRHVGAGRSSAADAQYEIVEETP